MQSRSNEIDRMYRHIADQYESGDTTSSERERYTNGSGFGSLYGHKLRQQHLQEDINSTFDFLNPLGNSRSSSVWKARHRSSKKLIALKGIEVDRGNSAQHRLSSLSVSTSSSTTAYYSDPVEQFQFLRTLDHPNIVKYYECHMYSQFCYISKEYCSGGNLLEVRTFPHAECNAKQYIKQLLSAIYYLHGKSIVHRNLKAQNLMLSEPLKGELKLVDFEFCSKIEDKMTYKDCPGNIHYAAPEIVRPRKGAELKKSDMWSIGVITYYLICGYFPFRGKSRKDILNKIRGSISNPVRYPPGVYLTETCKDFIEKLLSYSTDSRMSARDALQHEWIGEFVPSPPHSPDPTPDEELPSPVAPTSPGPLGPLTQTGSPSPPLDPLDHMVPITPPPVVEVVNVGNVSPPPSTPNSPSARTPSPRSHHRPGTMIIVNGVNEENRSPSPDPSRAASRSPPPESVMTNSISFALLNSMDGKLIDNLLDEVDEDEQKQAAIGPISLYKARSVSSRSRNSRSQSYKTQSIAMSRSKRSNSKRSNNRGNSNKRLKKLNESTLDFDVLSINGDMIDSILDEVDENERLIVAHDAMQKGPVDLNALAAASNVADEAIASMNAMLSFFRNTAGPGPQTVTSFPQ